MSVLDVNCERCTNITIDDVQIAMILNDEALFAEWKRNIATMAERIIGMRRELYRLLTEELKTPGNWDHIINQIGMFR